jgi:hypothetical protein
MICSIEVDVFRFHRDGSSGVAELAQVWRDMTKNLVQPDAEARPLPQCKLHALTIGSSVAGLAVLHIVALRHALAIV